DYMQIYERVFEECSKSAPWIIIPADKKWYRNYLVANVIIDAFTKMIG
ncbi:MAG: polyphosphate kinase 2 family protein, partial [Sphingobacteriales bacterium]